MTDTASPVLAAEDEESDAMILKLAFRRAGLTNPLVVVPDGRDLIDYLQGHGPFANRAVHPLPVLLLLDLKMPRMNGFDVLAWLAAHPEFKHLPAVVLSSSPDQSDIRRAREAGARDYLVKPHSIGDFVAIVQSLRARWLETPASDSESSTATPT